MPKECRAAFKYEVKVTLPVGLMYPRDRRGNIACVAALFWGRVKVFLEFLDSILFRSHTYFPEWRSAFTGCIYIQSYIVFFSAERTTCIIILIIRLVNVCAQAHRVLPTLIVISQQNVADARVIISVTAQNDLRKEKDVAPG